VERVDPNALACSPGLNFATREKRVEVNAFHLLVGVMDGYQGRLYHQTPAWVKGTSVFHLRFRADPEQSPVLIDPILARELIAAAQKYHELGHWWCNLFLLMPDHVHAMLSFPRVTNMSVAIRNWKRGTSRFQKVCWQENFFGHRIRHQAEIQETWRYIFRNPVVKGLCPMENDWPHWWSALTPTR